METFQLFLRVQPFNGSSAEFVGSRVRSQKANQVRAEVVPIITAIQATGAISLRAIAAELDAREIPTPRRLGEWSAVQVQKSNGAIATGLV